MTELIDMNPKEIRDFIGSKSFIEDQDTNRIIINLLLKLVEGKEASPKKDVVYSKAKSEPKKTVQKKTQTKRNTKK